MEDNNFMLNRVYKKILDMNVNLSDLYVSITEATVDEDPDKIKLVAELITDLETRIEHFKGSVNTLFEQVAGLELKEITAEETENGFKI